MDRRYEDVDSGRRLSEEFLEDTAMLGEDRKPFSTPPRKRPRSSLTLISLILNLVLIFVVLGLGAVLCTDRIKQKEDAKSGEVTTVAPQKVPQKVEKQGLMGEINGIVPDFSTELVIFDADFRFANTEMFTNETEFNLILNRWKDDVPTGRGFVTIEDKEKYDLPPPMKTKSNPGADGYSIAVFHQFHCLYMIMKSFGNHRFGKPMTDPDMERHVTHCFDYIRQSILCSGDSSLEGQSKVVKGMTDGWGAKHLCKSEKQMRKWIVDNRFTNNTGI